MPLRGESVGTAYVRILADGSRLADSIKDELGDTEPVLRGQGTSDAEAYADGFEKHMKSAPTRKKMREGVVDSLARGNAIEQFLRSPKWRETERSLVKRFGEVGQRMGANLANSLIESGDFDQFNARFDNLIAEAAKATQEIQRAEEEADRERQRNLDATLKRQKAAITQMHQEIARGIKATSQTQTRALRDLVRETDQMLANTKANMRITRTFISEVQADIAEFDRIDRERAREAKAEENAQRKRLRDLADAFDLLRERVEHYNRGINQSRSSRARYLRELKDLSERMEIAGGATDRFKLHVEDVDRVLRRSNPTLDRFSERMDRVSFAVGRTFGRGSRNDFLNFFGRFVGALASLPGLLTRVASNVINFGRKIGDAFTNAGGGLQGFGAASITALAPLALLGAAMVGLFLLLGPIAAAISLLTAAVIALAGSLTFALAGALAAVAGLLTPVIVGVGVLVGGLIAKKGALKNIFKPLTDELKELGQVAGQPIIDSLKRSLEDLGPVIEGLEPLAEKVGKAIGTAIEGFADGLKGPGFRQFTRFLERVIPGMVRKLGRIFENVFGGLAGLFRALTPITNEFLRWLERITERFDEWINSKDGQREMREFLERAADSAKSVGGFIREAAGALGDLFSAGKGTGDSIFDTLTRKLQEFRDFLVEAREEGTLQKWFDDAEKFAERLGNAVLAIVGIIEKFDSDETREELNKIVEAINNIAGAIAAIGKFGGAMSKALAPLQFLIAFDKLPGQLKKIGDEMDRVGDKINKKFRDLIGGADRLGDGIRNALLGMFDRIADAWNRQIDRIKRVWESLKATGTGLKNFINKKWDEIVSDAANAAVRITKQVNKWVTAGRLLGEGLIEGLKNLPGAAGLIGSVANAVRDAAIVLLNSAIDRINSALEFRIEVLGKGITINAPDIPHLALGGITSGPSIAGEAGREAVVPLDRPLSQIDPAVRELAAFARGMETSKSNSKTLDASGWTIITPTTDSRAVADEILGRLAVFSYA